MDRFTERGGWWVVAQVALLVGIFFAWLAWGGYWGTIAVVAGLGLAFAGAVLGIAGLGYLGRNLTPYPVPRGGTVLVDRGPYALVRHPIYGGLVVGSAGMAIADGNAPALVLCGGLFVVFTFKAAVEERHLKAVVDGYDDYCTRVRWRIIPFVP